MCWAVRSTAYFNFLVRTVPGEQGLFSILVIFTPPLIFPEPLKPAAQVFSEDVGIIGLTIFSATSVRLPRVPRGVAPNTGQISQVKNSFGRPGRGSNINLSLRYYHIWWGWPPTLFAKFVEFGNSRQWFHFRFSAKIQGAIAPWPLQLPPSSFRNT